MVRTRSPVRIWLSAPEKTSLTTRDVFSGAGGHLRQKALPIKRSAFFFRCVSSPSKTFLTTRDVFFGAGGIFLKSTPNKEECFFLPLCFISVKNIPYNGGGVFLEPGGHLRPKHSQQRGVLFSSAVSNIKKKHSLK